MSLVKIRQEKENKIFKKWDILIYSIIIVIIAVLFLTIFLTKDNSKIEGFKIEISGESVYTYDFESAEQSISADYNIEVYDKTDSGFAVKVVLGDFNEDYNVFWVNTKDRQISVLETDCSVSKDCMTMSIKTMSDTIICVPHNLVVTPLGEGTIEDPVIG